MAKGKTEDIVFCDECGGSIAKGSTRFVIDQPDGTKHCLCQECKTASLASEDQPTLAVDGMDEDEAPGDPSDAEGAITEDSQPVATAVEEEEPEPEPVGGVVGGVTYTHCKTFVGKAAPRALEYVDLHIMDYIRAKKIRVKHASVCTGRAPIGSQGLKEDALFITIWW